VPKLNFKFTSSQEENQPHSPTYNLVEVVSTPPFTYVDFYRQVYRVKSNINL